MAFELAEEKGLFQKDGSSLYSASVYCTAHLCVSFATWDIKKTLFPRLEYVLERKHHVSNSALKIVGASSVI